MPLSDSLLNDFALGLVAKLKNRAKGLDANSARIVNVRPSDHVLAGFLTPLERPSPLPASTNGEAESDDLPRDSSYEQTSAGLEWLVDSDELRHVDGLEATLSFSVYVRHVPSFEEQTRLGVWRQRRPAATEPQPMRVQDVVRVWCRHDVPNIKVILPVQELLRRGKSRIELSHFIEQHFSKAPLSRLYPGSSQIELTESDLRDEKSLDSRLERSASFKPAWKAYLDARLVSVPTRSHTYRVALRLMNDSETVPRASLDFRDTNLYAVSLSVTVPASCHRSMVFEELPDSFRYDRSMAAVGINADVESVTREGVIQLRAETVPIAQAPRLEARDLETANPTFDSLATDPLPVLRAIYEEMVRYDAQAWATKLKELDGQERVDAEQARATYRKEFDRYMRGVEMLQKPEYGHALRSFCLMNRAMAAASKGFAKWRLFQIVFVVSTLRELAAREYPELSMPDDGCIDLLWFAAGGGKTEAFTGLILWQSFFDRLRGKRFGTTALVRFPLRLLTFQQLQRLGRAMAAGETIRKDEKLRGARFSLGYFVGSTSTPNDVSDDLHARFNNGVDARYQIVFSCPFCGSPVELSYNGDNRLIEHRCNSKTCPGGDDRLPVYVTDTDIYRYLPTVIVSTVDKMALLGQNQRFANLFGRIDMICHEHGASFRDTNKKRCAAAKDRGKDPTVSSCCGHTLELGPFHDLAPALLIQDELHLLTEELGTFDAHYETGAIQLARALGAKPWKVIGASATIQDFKKQAWELYLRDSRQFPAPGPDAYDSFYYTQNKDRIGRLFIALLGVGRKHTPSVTKTLALLYAELQRARELAQEDVAEACRDMGIKEITLEEFSELVFLYELPLTYVLTRKGSDQVAEAVESRVKGELQDTCPRHDELLVEMFNGGVDVSRMISVMEEIKGANWDSPASERIRGIVTTNIIGHGVDVDRFNIMVFAGFTRLVAEYIQASARVGRRYPGLSIFVATPQSERDRSIFDRFAKFHQYLDRLVDPAAITRWPEPALERTVPGLLCGYLMGVAAHRVGRPLATVEAIQSAFGKPGCECLNMDEVVAWMLRAYGSEQAPSTKYGERVTNKAKNAYSRVVNSPARQGGGMPQALNTYLNSMNSLRDVDDPAFIVAASSSDSVVLRRLING